MIDLSLNFIQFPEKYVKLNKSLIEIKNKFNSKR